MCGVAGLVSLTDASGVPPLERVLRMTAALGHRGPDEAGVYRDERAALGHARLAILDLRGGSQPLCNEDRTLWIAFNGEIFNYLELRQELIALGHRFATRSDTEVIVHACEEWGESAFARFNGQFAVALWDARKHVLTLARDRFGITPLYYREDRGRVLFASEVKALFAGDPGLARALDPVGIEQVFTFWSPIAPRTVFEGVCELPPGRVRTYARGDVRERAFALPRYPVGRDGEFSGAMDEATDEVRSALLRATGLRALRADVPVGCYLSGGLDSSLVAALAQEARPGRLCTFSLRFEDEEYDETKFQRCMAALLESEHHEVVVSRRQIAETFPEVIAHAERPLLRTAPAPLFHLSRLVREAGCKVVLTGEGADEMFAGYDLFREAKVRRFWARQPSSSARPRLLERLYPYLQRSPVAQQAMARRFFGQELERASAPGFAHAVRWRATAALRRLFSPAHHRALAGRDVAGELLSSLPDEFRSWSPLAQDQHLEVVTLLSGYLLSAQGDRMLMAHSVEGRFPFLDVEVAALADALPPRFKLRGLDEKHVLKRVARGLVPDEIRLRKKQPYRAPDALSFCGRDTPAWMEQALSEEALRSAGVFDSDAVRRLFRKCRDRDDGQFSHADNMAVCGVLSTQLLHQLFVERPPAPRSGVRLTVHVDRVAEARR